LEFASLSKFVSQYGRQETKNNQKYISIYIYIYIYI